MAQKTKRDAVQFTRESAERIGRVVRAAETSGGPSSPLSFEPYFDARKTKQVRAATFSGAWPVGSTNTVTFTNAPTATAWVMNLSWPITGTHSNDNCIVGKDGTAWYLVVPVLATAKQTVITSIAISAVLDTQTCAIAVSQTANTAAITYLKIKGA